MRVMGLDLSLTGTGVCLPDGSTTLIKTGSLKGCERLSEIRSAVAGAVFLPDMMPQLVVVEDYAAHAKGDESGKAELHGVILLAFYDWSIPVAKVNPSTLKAYVVGGGAKKEDMKLAAYKHYRREFASSDECDAFWLYVMALEQFGQAPQMVERRLAKQEAASVRSLAKVEWPEVAK